MIINQICTVVKMSRYYEKDNNGKKTDKVKGYFVNLLVPFYFDKKVVCFEFDRLYIKADYIEDVKILSTGNSISIVYDVPTLLSKYKNIVSVSTNKESKQYAIFI